MLWVLLWLGLVLGAAVVLGLLGRSLWRKVKALTGELSRASEQLSSVAASLNDLAETGQGGTGPRGTPTR